MIQRAGSAANLNIHFHTLCVEGVLVEESSGAPRFVPLPASSDRSQASSARPSGGAWQPHRAQALRFCASAANPDAAWVSSSGPLHAHLAGLDLHAGVAVPDGDRKRLEHLCRYLLRPPIAQGALELMADGRVLLEIRRPWHDGTRAVRFEPIELIEKLASLVPRPRVNLLIYHGVLGPNVRLRRAAVCAVSEVAHLLGHSSPAVTLKVYTHWFKNKNTDSTTRLAAAILGPSNGADGRKVVADDGTGETQEAISARCF